MCMYKFDADFFFFFFFWENGKVFNLAILQQMHLEMVYIALWNPLLLDLLLDLFKPLHIHYRLIENMHMKLWCWTNISLQNDRIFNLAILGQLHLVNDG